MPLSAVCMQYFPKKVKKNRMGPCIQSSCSVQMFFFFGGGGGSEMGLCRSNMLKCTLVALGALVRNIPPEKVLHQFSMLWVK